MNDANLKIEEQNKNLVNPNLGAVHEASHKNIDVNNTPRTNHSPKNNKKKLFYIIAILLVLFVLCVSVVLFLVSLVSQSVEQKRAEVVDSVLYDVCQTHGNLTYEQYSKWFDSNISYSDAVFVTSQFYNKGYDCESLKKNGIIDILTSGESINYNMTNNIETLGILNNQSGNEIELTKTSSRWFITYMKVETVR